MNVIVIFFFNVCSLVTLIDPPVVYTIYDENVMKMWHHGIIFNFNHDFAKHIICIKYEYFRIS